MKIFRILIIIISFNTFSYTSSFTDIKKEFPSYQDIFSEFGIDESFINNKEFIQFVERHKREFRYRYKKGLKRGELIIPTMQEMLHNQKISPLFIYISMVESGFSPTAISRSGEGGLWQIGKNSKLNKFNLHIDENVDERYDPIKATASAINYLFQMNANLDKWYLTIMAYNCGTDCVNKAIERAGTKDLGILISSNNSYILGKSDEIIT